MKESTFVQLQKRLELAETLIEAVIEREGLLASEPPPYDSSVSSESELDERLDWSKRVVAASGRVRKALRAFDETGRGSDGHPGKTR